MEKYKKFIPYVVGVLFIGYMIVSNFDFKKDTETKLEAFIPVEQGTNIIVEIKGEVLRPGIYKIDSNMRLFEVILLAGGFTKDAQVESLNLAQFLSDGMSIYISAKTLPDTPQNRNKVSINEATSAMLMELKGIGEAKAKAIIAYRTMHGPFTKLEDLMKVSGISEAMYHQIQDDIRL